MYLGALSDARSLIYLEEQVRHRISAVETRFDVTIEIHTFSRADMPDVSWRESHLLVGHVAGQAPDAGRTHSEKSARAANISRFIAELLERDSTLVSRAIRHVDYLLESEQGTASHDLREWRDILSDYSSRRLRDFLTSDAPRAQRLRQSSSFFSVLTVDEREELLDRLAGEQ